MSTPGHQTDPARPSDRPADPASATFPAAVTPKPGDTVRVRLDYVGEVDVDGEVCVPVNAPVRALSVCIRVAQPDTLPDCWTVEIVAPPLDEPTRLGTVVVDAEGDRAVCIGGGGWQIVGAAAWFRWAALTRPVRLATEEERG